MIEVADASVIAILNNKQHRNKVYNLTGAETITDAAVSKWLTKHYGTLNQHTWDTMITRHMPASQQGLNEWEVKDAAAFELIKASGIDELLSASCITRILKKLRASSQNLLKISSTLTA
jgi:hypothetical protein